MNPKNDLDKVFLEAVEKVNNHTQPFPADFLLRLYAFYKRATNDESRPSSKNNLINAFKTNALFQAREVNTGVAKQNYIELVHSYFNKEE